MSPIFEYARDLYREMRGEWYVYLEAEYAAAERGAHGSMLNVEGRRQGIDAFDLLTAPWPRVLQLASPELVEWFESHGRPSPSQFEREWFQSWLGEEPLPPAPLCTAEANHSQPCACAVMPREEPTGALPKIAYEHQADC